MDIEERNLFRDLQSDYALIPGYMYLLERKGKILSDLEYSAKEGEPRAVLAWIVSRLLPITERPALPKSHNYDMIKAYFLMTIAGDENWNSQQIKGMENGTHARLFKHLLKGDYEPKQAEKAFSWVVSVAITQMSRAGLLRPRERHKEAKEKIAQELTEEFEHNLRLGHLDNQLLKVAYSRKSNWRKIRRRK